MLSLDNISDDLAKETTKKEKTGQQYGSATFGLLTTVWHCKGPHIKGEVMQPLDHDAKPLYNLHRLHLWEHFVY